jgi:hypothetical protein
VPNVLNPPVVRQVEASAGFDQALAGLGSITLVSADRDFNAAATAERLTVEDPNTHP